MSILSVSRFDIFVLVCVSIFSLSQASAEQSGLIVDSSSPDDSSNYNDGE